MQKIGGNPQAVENFRILRFFDELDDLPPVIRVHDPKSRRCGAVHRDRADGNVRGGLEMLPQNAAVIHSVKLIAAEDDIVIDLPLEEVAEVLPDRVGCSLIPLRSLGSLLRGEDLHEARCEIVELETGIDMPVQRHAVELGEHVDAANAGVETIAYRNVDQPVLAAKRHRRLGAFLRQGKEPGAGAAPHNYCQSAISGKNQGKLTHSGI